MATTVHDDVLLIILTDRLRLLIQIHDDDQPGMRARLQNIERCLSAYRMMVDDQAPVIVVATRQVA